MRISVKVIDFLRNNKIARISLATILLFLFLFCAFLFGKFTTLKKFGKTVFLTDVSIDISESWVNPFPDIKDEISFYIIEICKPLKIEPEVVLAILLQENPMQDPYATNINSNGTVDCGLFQINSKYTIYFAEKYWKFDVFNEEFDVFNWKKNAWVATHIINDYYSFFHKDIEKTAAAYNAGVSRVFNEQELPAITLNYKKQVKSHYNNLKNH